MANRINHQDFVKKVLDAKAVDFTAIGKVIAEVGPSLSMSDEPWEGVCGTVRNFVHVWRLPGTNTGPGIPELGNVGSEVE
jgi:hypothetical protein